MEAEDTTQDMSEPIRTSFYAPRKYQVAMEIIKKHRKIYHSHQIQLGLDEYFKSHADLLAKHGIDVWED